MEQNVKQLIRNAFQKVIEDPNANENVIRQFFSEDYVQHVFTLHTHLTSFLSACPSNLYKGNRWVFFLQ